MAELAGDVLLDEDDAIDQGESPSQAFDAKALPLDFRLQLEIIRYMTQQRALMQEIASKQDRVGLQLEELISQSSTMQKQLSQQFECTEKASEQTERVNREMGQVKEHVELLRHASLGEFPKYVKKANHAEAPTSPHVKDAITLNAVEIHLSDPVECDASPQPGIGANIVDTDVFGASSDARLHLLRAATPSTYTNEGACRGDAPEPEHNNDSRTDGEPPSFVKSTTKSSLFDSVQHINLGPELHNDHWLRRVVTSNVFEGVCAFVIMCNAVVIGIVTQDEIMWALSQKGHGERPQGDWAPYLGYAFMAFYSFEVLLKIQVFRCGFFTNNMRAWNLFDIFLVLLSLHDFVSVYITSGDGNDSNFAWLRLLRLVKMLKMLRVVRVLRFFRVLRMMVESIAGSLMTLMWSILLLSLMMYTFGLCFLQALSAYLEDTPRDNVGEVTLEAINTYWSSVPQATITLYLAVTGGSDWEPLSTPVREAGEIYYMLFLFYIAFTAFAVLNVLTGMYVDTASSVAKNDTETVGAELLERPETLQIKEYLRTSSEKMHGSGLQFRWSAFAENIDADVVQDFIKMAEATPEECERVFKLLDMERIGLVDIDAFVKGCLYAKSSMEGVDMLYLVSESRRYGNQQRNLMSYVSDSFDEIHVAMGSKPSCVEPLGSRLTRARCLPHGWPKDERGLGSAGSRSTSSSERDV
mmetsp:Transcript_116997/g.331082  ORF Transcript_116997/g.331082 Transcript_116997/m.331082 type:complete len:696 (+) Transcript_116997:84-2171(+)